MNIKRILSLVLFVLNFTLISPIYAQNAEKNAGIEVSKDSVKTNIQSNTSVNINLINNPKSETTKKEQKTSSSDKKYKEVDSKLITTMVFNLIGGLGIFLLGMRYMSDGLQTIAGNSLKKLIKAVTDNRFMACGVGVMVTLLVQSSSVTTVMAVGFVNSTIMELNQAIGIILGANIGTTITGWVLFLKIGKWGLPILGISAFVYLFNRKCKILRSCRHGYWYDILRS